jgi:hypothetical protein
MVIIIVVVVVVIAHASSKIYFTTLKIAGDYAIRSIAANSTEPKIAMPPAATASAFFASESTKIGRFALAKLRTD